MQDEIPDLWPDEIQTTEVPTPIAILRIQANRLHDKTKGLIEAEVRSLTDNDKAQELYQFDLIAPALDGYRLRLFECGHALSLVYPIDIYWREFDQGYSSASTPGEVYEALRTIFRSRTTTSIIMSMIARSNERKQSSTVIEADQAGGKKR